MRYLIAVSLFLFLISHLSKSYAAVCTVIGNEKYGDCDFVILQTIPKNKEPKEISGTFISLVSGDAYVEGYARIYGAISGNLVIKKNGRAIVYGSISGNIINYGSLSVFSSVTKDVINYENGSAEISGYIGGKLIGDNFDISSGSMINGKVIP